MNKELPLTLAVLAGAAILWVLVGRDPQPQDAVDTVDTGASQATRANADDLVDIASKTAAPVATSTWSVTVVDAKTGEAVPSATVEATHGTDKREASAAARWIDVAPGDWTLTVHAKGYPDWAKSVTIESGENAATTVELDPTLRVSGLVVSARGERMGYHEVLFLRPGQSKPKARPDVQKLPLMRTDKNGRFELDLPGPGAWHTHVTYGGKAVYVQDVPSTLIHGGPSRALMTIPAPTRLLVRVEDPTVEGEPPAYTMSLYRDPSMVPNRPAVQPQAPRPELDPSALSEEDRKEIDADRESVATAFGDPNDPESARRKAEHAAAQAIRSSVRPEGWVMAKSLRLRKDGTAEVPGVPPGEELRAAIGRNGEAIRVNGSMVLQAEQTTLARIILPPAPPAGALPAAAPITAELVLETLGIESSPSTTGVVWR